MNTIDCNASPVLHESTSTEATPLDTYRTLYDKSPMSFLYESLQTDGRRGKYSFLGGRPIASVTVHDKSSVVEIDGERTVDERDVKEILRGLLKTLPTLPHVEPLAGGLIGYFAYDYVRKIENLPDGNPDDLRIPHARFIIPGELIVFDHATMQADIVLIGEVATASRMRQLQATLRIESPLRNATPQQATDAIDFNVPPSDASTIDNAIGATDSKNDGSARQLDSKISSNVKPEAFEAAVNQALEYIHAGDIFQGVLSQRFSFPTDDRPLDLFAALRETNPSHYMYFLNFDDMHVLGSSPELLAQKKGHDASVRPLAGTRPRGIDAVEDKSLEIELCNDIKERAEHVMLVDLARNDLGRVCEYGTVKTTNLLEVERYARVMHLVSNVSGTLRHDCDAFDLFDATFPAGTVSGAPKVRAMEIIDELETTRRGLYAGAIGYVNERGDMDTCIAIRNIVIKNGVGYIQAGAGVVADSQPSSEYRETLNKAYGMLNAVEKVGRTHDTHHR